MRIGWGNRILLLYLGFVALIVTLVVMSYKVDINLVRADYYEQEKLYDSKYLGMQNIRDLGKDVEVNFTEKGIAVMLPNNPQEGEMAGSIHFFRPSGAGLDVLDSFKLSETNSLVYANENFQKGKYLLWVNWKQGDKNYYSEQAVIVK